MGKILFLFLSLNAVAEYRAFQLVIKDAAGNITRSFASTLTPNQYREFFPLEAQTQISYSSTWMCFGRTDWTHKICPDPKTLEPAAPTEGPESGNSP